MAAEAFAAVMTIIAVRLQWVGCGPSAEAAFDPKRKSDCPALLPQGGHTINYAKRCPPLVFLSASVAWTLSTGPGVSTGDATSRNVLFRSIAVVFLRLLEHQAQRVRNGLRTGHAAKHHEQPLHLMTGKSRRWHVQL